MESQENEYSVTLEDYNPVVVQALWKKFLSLVKDNTGNGAREALVESILDNYAYVYRTEPDTFETVYETVDVLLAKLWTEGYKVVPLEPDYREILKNYIHHVGTVEGSTFIGKGVFSKEDEVLIELEKEAFNENN